MAILYPPQRQRKKLSPEEAAVCQQQRTEAQEKAATASAGFESDIDDKDYGTSDTSGEEASSDSDSSRNDIVMTNQEVIFS